MSYKEPRQTISKKDSDCPKCGKVIKEGSPCTVDPKRKEAYHTKCFKITDNTPDNGTNSSL